MNNNDDNLDELVKQLKGDTKELKKEQKKPTLVLNDENVNDYIMNRAGTLIEGGVNTIEALKESILTSCEAREIESFAELFKAVTSAVDVLNKINIQNKKTKTAKEIKEMDNNQRQLEGPKQTNVLVATREEIIKGFLNKNEKIIEANYDENGENNE